MVMVRPHLDESDADSGRGRYIGPIRMDVTFGNIINMVILICAIAGWWAASESGKATLTQKFDDFQASVNIQLTEMRAAFNTVIGQTVTIGEMQSHLHAIDGRMDGLDARTRDGESERAKVRAELDNLIRSSAVALPSDSTHRR